LEGVPILSQRRLRTIIKEFASSNIGIDRAGFLRWQRMAAQGRRIIKNSGRRIIIYAGN
jgi:hypothetical protein